jgi:hypothetical protein
VRGMVPDPLSGAVAVRRMVVGSAMMSPGSGWFFVSGGEGGEGGLGAYAVGWLEEVPIRGGGGVAGFPADLFAREGDAGACASGLGVAAEGDGAQTLGDEGAVDRAIFGGELVGDEAAAGGVAAAGGEQVDEVRDEGGGGADGHVAAAAVEAAKAGAAGDAG